MTVLTRKHKQGFTLVELLIVVVVVGILAALAIPRFANTKGKSYASSMKSDLRNLAGQQETYFHQNESYSGNLADVSFEASPGVVLSITQATVNGWSAIAVHPGATPVTCAVFYGAAAPVAPATIAGVINCQ